jgi:hypothetical protein
MLLFDFFFGLQDHTLLKLFSASIVLTICTVLVYQTKVPTDLSLDKQIETFKKTTIAVGYTYMSNIINITLIGTIITALYDICHTILGEPTYSFIAYSISLMQIIPIFVGTIIGSVVVSSGIRKLTILSNNLQPRTFMLACIPLPAILAGLLYGYYSMISYIDFPAMLDIWASSATSGGTFLSRYLRVHTYASVSSLMNRLVIIGIFLYGAVFSKVSDIVTDMLGQEISSNPAESELKQIVTSSLESFGDSISDASNTIFTILLCSELYDFLEAPFLQYSSSVYIPGGILTSIAVYTLIELYGAGVNWISSYIRQLLPAQYKIGIYNMMLDTCANVLYFVSIAMGMSLLPAKLSTLRGGIITYVMISSILRFMGDWITGAIRYFSNNKGKLMGTGSLLELSAYNLAKRNSNGDKKLDLVYSIFFGGIETLTVGLVAFSIFSLVTMIIERNASTIENAFGALMNLLSKTGKIDLAKPEVQKVVGHFSMIMNSFYVEWGGILLMTLLKDLAGAQLDILGGITDSHALYCADINGNSLKIGTKIIVLSILGASSFLTKSFFGPEGGSVFSHFAQASVNGNGWHSSVIIPFAIAIILGNITPMLARSLKNIQKISFKGVDQESGIQKAVNVVHSSIKPIVYLMTTIGFFFGIGIRQMNVANALDRRATASICVLLIIMGGVYDNFKKFYKYYAKQRASADALARVDVVVGYDMIGDVLKDILYPFAIVLLTIV